MVTQKQQDAAQDKLRFIKHTSINLKGYKKYKLCSPTTMEWS
jgi:hypothetical protein